MTNLSAALVSPTTGDLQHRVEQFLYAEAQLLDDHRYAEWLDLFSSDARYWMPTRSNRLLREHDKEVSVEGEFALFDDNPARINTLVSEFDKVTPALIQKTAQEYLRPENRTVLVLETKSAEAPAAPAKN